MACLACLHVLTYLPTYIPSFLPSFLPSYLCALCAPAATVIGANACGGGWMGGGESGLQTNGLGMADDDGCGVGGGGRGRRGRHSIEARRRRKGEGRAELRSKRRGCPSFTAKRRPICLSRVQSPDQLGRQHSVDHGQDSRELRPSGDRREPSCAIPCTLIPSLPSLPSTSAHFPLFFAGIDKYCQIKGDLTSKQLMDVEKALCLDDQFRFRFPDPSLILLLYDDYRFLFPLLYSVQ